MKPLAGWLPGCVVIIAAFGVFIPDRAPLAHEADAPKPAVNEFYYRVKWGYFDEFMELFKKNHYPILARLKDDGVILDMYASYPASHAAESQRWDMRFTVVLADPKHTYEYMYGPELIKELYPDQEAFRKEEQRRFELLEEHMDVPMKMDDLSGWRTTPE
ncbi:MAG: hypothetical protein KJO31_15840 [Gammaproteobacteria bacterium]|nr:hypothetical protein [Gammaproteobacteria bacterium]